MSAGREAAGGRQVYRSAGALVAWWGWANLAVAVLAVIAVRHHDHAAAVAAAVIVAVTGVMYACAFRPRVVADPDGIRLVNPLRTHLIPWPAVIRVEAAQTLRVGYTGATGREATVHSWAVQSSPRADARRELRARRAARAGVPGPGYARLPPVARAASQGSVAEFAARQLTERLARERRQAGAPARPGPGSPAVTPGSAPPAAQAAWDWAAMAAIGAPLLLLAVLVLA